MDMWEFTVQGRWDFPVDMLRYDRCWPKYEDTSGHIADSFKRRRDAGENHKIVLVGLNEPTMGRWESFGWKVTECEKRSR